MKTPCPECPFYRRVKPGALGGSPPEVYVGQAVLPFWLPCHKSSNYAGKASDVNEVSECHGAATFRANIRDQLVATNPALLSLPEDKERVFGSLAEFYAHHHGISLADAEAILKPDVITALADQCWRDANVRMQLKRSSK